MSNPDNDLEVLLPDQEVEVGLSLPPEHIQVLKGKTVTVRELRFAQTLKISNKLNPLINELRTAFSGGQDDQSIIDKFYQYPDLLLELLELSTGESREFLENLNDEDSYNLVVIFFGVHNSFFGRRLIAALVQKEQLNALKAPVDGA